MFDDYLIFYCGATFQHPLDDAAEYELLQRGSMVVMQLEPNAAPGQGDVGDDDDDPWMIVAIVFIVVSLLLLIVSAVLLFKSGKFEKNGGQRGGYSQTDRTDVADDADL